MKIIHKIKSGLKKELAKMWSAFVEGTRKATPINANDSTADIEKRRKKLEANPEEWFKYYFPQYAYSEPAPFHKRATKRIIENPEWYEVRMWSRELAKSTRTMMEVMYLTLVGHMGADGKRKRKRYVMLVSNSADNAIRLLLPYRGILSANQRIIQDYGTQEKPGQWEASEFTSQKGVAFRALGVGQSPRGARNEEVRPDILLFDDVDTDAECINPEQVAKKWRWIEEAAIGTRSISAPTTIIFCGNRIANDCCVWRATKFADKTDLINIRDADGRSSWPQKNTEEHIDRVLKQKSYAAQQKEYYNNPITEGAVFKKLNYKPIRPLKEYEMLCCYSDPSYKSTADYKATVLVGKLKNEFHIIKAKVEQTTTAELIRWHYEIMDMVAGLACYYYIEEVFLQDVIRKEIADAGKTNGRTIPIIGDTRAKPDKYMRIESLLEPLNRNGHLYLNAAQQNDPGMMMLAQQFIAFAPGSRAHDDAPDAVEGAVWIITNKFIAQQSKPIVINRNRNSNSKSY